MTVTESGVSIVKLALLNYGDSNLFIFPQVSLTKDTPSTINITRKQKITKKCSQLSVIKNYKINLKLKKKIRK